MVRETHRLAGSKMSGGCTPTLNLASGVDSLVTPSRPGSEAELEKRLAGADPEARSRLMSKLGLALLVRQMPVGVYDGPPRTGGAIFTGGRAPSTWSVSARTGRSGCSNSRQPPT